MNGRRSKLADKIYIQYKDRVLEGMKTNTLIGQSFEIDGKTYKITNGEIDIDSILERINHLIKKEN